MRRCGIIDVMNDMQKEEPRPILYGVSDYARIRQKNAWFVDRTVKIRDLEKVSYALFLRPRRFGKSLLCSILEAYYDVDCAHRFEELFHVAPRTDGEMNSPLNAASPITFISRAS